MLGLLIAVVDKAKANLPEFTITDAQGGFDVFARKPKYTMGLRPQYIGDQDVHVARIRVAQSDDGVDLVVEKDRATHRFPLTIANSGRLEGEGLQQGWEFDWRFDEATAELCRCLQEP